MLVPDVDECKLQPSPCHDDATCTNNVGSFTCDCLPGYAGNGLDCSGMHTSVCFIGLYKYTTSSLDQRKHKEILYSVVSCTIYNFALTLSAGIPVPLGIPDPPRYPWVGSGEIVYPVLPVNFDLDISPRTGQQPSIQWSSDQLSCNKSVICQVFCRLLSQACTLGTNIRVINRVATAAVSAVIRRRTRSLQRDFKRQSV